MKISVFLSFLLWLCLATFAQAQSETSISVWVSKNVAPSSKIRVAINTRNLPVVRVAAYPIDGEAWLSHLGTAIPDRPIAKGKAVVQWHTSVATKDQKPNPNQADTFYSRQINLPLLKPGVYLLTVTNGTKEAWAVVNVTHLAVVVKRSPTNLLVWVTDSIKGNDVPSAQVNLYTSKGKLKKTLHTQADGAVLCPLPPGEETLVVKSGSDMAGLETSATDPNGKLVAHFQTDRPIYRPGQTVYFKSILRRTLGQSYSVSKNAECKVQLRDSKDNPIDELNLKTNDMGTVNGRFDIPSEGVTGAYSLVLTTGNDSAYQTVTVAAFRKPEFKVDVTTLAKRYLSGNKIQFKVNAAFFFGSPVQQAEIRYQVRRSSKPFYDYDPNEGWFYGGDGNLYARDTYNENPFVAEDKAFTDADGNAVITVPSDPNAPDSDYSITCTVTDASRRQAEASCSVPVYTSSIRLGIRTDMSYATLGTLIPFKIRLVDLDGNSVAGKVNLVLTHREWVDKEKNWVERTLLKTVVVVPASGRLTYKIPAKVEGTLTLKAYAKDAEGRPTHSSTNIWVAGNYIEPTVVKPQPKVEVRLDQRVYRPGDIAKAFVSTNNPGRPILVVVEGGDVWEYQVLTTSKAGQVCNIKTGTRLSPNAYVSAEQWIEGRLISANTILPIPDPAKALTIKVTPDKKEYRPGDKAHYAISTYDRNGKPVSAEVAISVVDEAIYALSPDVTADIYGFYWGERHNQVTMFSSAPEEMSGGAYQRVSTVAPLRKRFEDTAYWKAEVLTDASGTGHVDFEVPGNLTSWRTTARGVTEDTCVGMAVSNVLANRPVMLRLATPRQMVQGDKLTLIGTLDNRSGLHHEFDVTLKGEGFRITGDLHRHVKMDAKKQLKIEWQIEATNLLESGAGVLTAEAVATDMSADLKADYSDALQVRVPIVPAGVAENIVVGQVISQKGSVNLDLPGDRIEPATKTDLQIAGGIGALARTAGEDVLKQSLWGTVHAASQLEAAAYLGRSRHSKEVRESLALLAKNQQSNGWGWWEQGATDAVITSQVLWSLATAERAKLGVYDNLISRAKSAATEKYNQTNLWEHRALLAAALLASGDDKGKDLIDEVRRRGENISPYAKLRMAEAMAIQNVSGSDEFVEDALKDVSNGPASSFLPVGYGTGWTASSIETTAQAVATLSRLNQNLLLQRKFAHWLAFADNSGWRSTLENTAVAHGLSLYASKHPEATEIGDVELTVNGSVVPTTKGRIGDVVKASIPQSLLKSGNNRILVTRKNGGELFLTVQSAVYRPNLVESVRGVRVLRRFEVQNDAKIWVELKRQVHPGEPVRCTVVAWGDDVPDGMRVVEPIAAGFEFVEGEYTYDRQEDVRDGAIIHSMVNQGQPQTYRYYLRAEAEGKLLMLPATAEYVRRPADRGQSNGDKVQVKVQSKVRN